jgi:tetratricopeptide (TPR) repeat protein
MKPLICTLFLAVSTSFCLAAEQESSGEGNRFFVAGDYERAARSYQLELSADGHSSVTYTNLGLAHQKTGNIGEASLNFLRALSLDPTNQTAALALQQLTEEHQISAPAPSSLAPIFARLGNQTPWLIATTLAWTGGFLVVMGLLQKQGRKWWIGFGVVCFVAGKSFSAMALSSDPLFANRGLAVVTSPAAIEVKANPLEQAKGVARLNPGSAVEVLNTRGRWSYCAVADGRTGWVESAKLAEVIPGSTALLPSLDG